jgi:predicted ester cyclase
MSAETNKATVRRLFEEVFGRRNVAALDEFLAPGYVNHASIRVRGSEGAKRAVAAQFQAFPDLHTTIEDIIAEGDKVVVRATDHFTHQPDGKYVTLGWIEILRLENGKVVEAWAEADMSPILEQLNDAFARK